MTYASLHIEKFRSIASLDMNGLKPVNVLVGKNNSGKTSVLEALFLVSGMSSPQLAVNINLFRNINIEKADDLLSLFYQMEKQNHPYIKTDLRDLKIVPHVGGPKEIKGFNAEIISDTMRSSIAENSMDGLTFEFKVNVSSQTWSSALLFQPGMLQEQVARTYKETIPCHFLNTQSLSQNRPINISNLMQNNLLDDMIHALQEIEPAITDLRMGNNNILYAKTGQKLMPFNLMGGGTTRFLSILSGIAECKNGVCLIDEMENGFHYSAMKPLWRAVLKMAELNQVQLFITSHSDDCLRALSAVLTASKNNQVALFRLEHEGAKHQVVGLEPKELAITFEQGWEFR
jgi:AAA15 family ATPase/GTPase